MGADVIKVERREGDWQRSAGRGEPGRHGNPQFVELNRNKRDIGIDLIVRYNDTSDWYSNYRIGETTAAAKILIDQTNDQIVGAHLLGPEYGELINTLGLAIKLGLTTRQLKSMVANYPTVGSDLGSML